MGQAGHHGFYRVGHALLGLQRRVTGCGGVDLHLHIGDVRHRVNGQALVVVEAKAYQGEGGQHDQPALCNGKADDALKHGYFLSWRYQCTCSAVALPISDLSTKLPLAT